MRRIIVAVLVLLLAAAALPGAAMYRFGVQGEKQYAAFLERASESGRLKVEDGGYERGFTRSTARTFVEIEGADGSMGADPVRFVLLHDIEHGPFVLGGSQSGSPGWKPVQAVISTRLVIPPTGDRGVLQGVVDRVPEAVAPLMEIRTVIYLGGEGEAHVVMPARERVVAESGGGIVSWKGLTADVVFDAGLRSVRGEFSVPGLQVEGDDGFLRMDGLSSSFDVMEGLHGLHLGEASWNIADLEYRGKGRKGTGDFSAGGLGVKASSRAVGESVAGSLVFRVDRMELAGIGYKLGALDLEFRNLDASSLARFVQALSEREAPLPRSGRELASQLDYDGLMDVLPVLLRRSPEIEITRLEIASDEGSLRGGARAACDGAVIGALRNPLVLLRAVTASAELEVSDGMLRRFLAAVRSGGLQGGEGGTADRGSRDEDTHALLRADEELRSLVDRNYLLSEDGKCKVNASYGMGQVVWNGRSLPILSLLFE